MANRGKYDSDRNGRSRNSNGDSSRNSRSRSRYSGASGSNGRSRSNYSRYGSGHSSHGDGHSRNSQHYRSEFDLESLGLGKYAAQEPEPDYRDSYQDDYVEDVQSSEEYDDAAPSYKPAHANPSADAPETTQYLNPDPQQGYDRDYGYAASGDTSAYDQYQNDPYADGSYGSTQILTPMAPLQDTQFMGSIQPQGYQNPSMGASYVDPNDKKAVKAAKKQAKAAAKAGKKKSKGKKVVLGIVIALLVLLAGGAVAGFFYIKSINSGLNSLDSNVSEVLEPVSAMGEPFYVLILGSDSRSSGDSGRSDTIILARVDTASRQVTLISVPRDLKVNIPGYGQNKVNAAYQFGGAALAIKTINELAGISISHVVEIDFSGFEEIVDALGGVTVDVPANTYYKGVSVPEGHQTLNGEQALVFARCRKTYARGDYQRADNQKQLIKAVAKQVLETDLTNMPKLIKSMTNAVGTDMDVSDIVALALDMRGMDTSAIMTATVPSAPSTEAGVSYVLLYEQEWKEMMERVNNGEDPNPSDGSGTVNPWTDSSNGADSDSSSQSQ